MKQTKEPAGVPVFSLLKILLASYILTALLLALLSFLLYRVGLNEKIVSAVLTAIYVIAPFFAGFLAGKKLQSRKFLWGLVEGCAYFAILLLVSILVGTEGREAGNSFLTTLVLCGAGGMLGGMLS